MKVLELFCGTKSIGKAFKKNGHDVFSIDFDKQFKPNLVCNILDFNKKLLPKEWRKPDIIWASPPCQTFSIASIYRYWDSFGKPKSYKTFIGLAIAKKTVELINDFNPKFWFIENPRGMLRQQDFMVNLHRKTVTYCKYGAKVQKPTDIWTNAINWIPKKMCVPGSSCHESAKRGSDRGTQNQSRNPISRAIIPDLLCDEIVRVCENNLFEEQKVIERWF